MQLSEGRSGGSRKWAWPKRRWISTRNGEFHYLWNIQWCVLVIVNHTEVYGNCTAAPAASMP